MIATVPGAHVTRLRYDGATYFPIVNAGAMLGPEELAELVATSAPAPVRRFRCIVVTEEAPRDGAPLTLGRLAPTKPVPLTYGDSVFTIGCVQELAVLPAGCTVAGTDGPCLVGIGRLYESALAAIVWPAIVTGVLRGLCAEAIGKEAGDRFVVREVLRVTLGGVENNCLPGALILDTWEGDAAP